METVVKFTLQSIVGEIQKVLDTYPYTPYQQVFAIPDLRQELVDYVASQIPCLDSDFDKACGTKHKLPRNPLQAQLHLQSLINQGICSIMEQKSEWISRLFNDIQPNCEPSHWFG
ncbi:MAG: hypothetical protein IGS39_11475 [Calothrix sp. C42_A2020_038]|nr:hypothetical protein [Calothrix sp. C42_A2020_038]